MRELDSNVALVTGGSRGIGRALSIQLADTGATVYTCGRDEEALHETWSRAGEDAELIAQSADVTEPLSMEALVARIHEESGPLDLLVNNAGLLGPLCPIEETPLEGWRRTLEVNLDGTFIATREAIPALREADSPLVLNVSSSVGRRGRGGWGAYSVSKFGLEGLTEILADELDDACVVSVNPGGTATEMRARAYPDEDPETLPTPDEVAETMVLLARTLGPDQSGYKYNSRDLFEYVGRTPLTVAAELPRVDES